jgi:hypothetical protein
MGSQVELITQLEKDSFACGCRLGLLLDRKQMAPFDSLAKQMAATPTKLSTP